MTKIDLETLEMLIDRVRDDKIEVRLEIASDDNTTLDIYPWESLRTIQMPFNLEETK